MTTKQQWILAQYNASTEKNIPLFTRGLNIRTLANNPTPQPTVLKTVDFSSLGLAAVDRKIIQNDLQGTYHSLLENIAKGLIPAIQDDVEVLCLSVSADAATKITTALQDALAGMPDPNWQPQVMLSPAELAGYSEGVQAYEVEEAVS